MGRRGFVPALLPMNKQYVAELARYAMRGHLPSCDAASGIIRLRQQDDHVLVHCRSCGWYHCIAHHPRQCCGVLRLCTSEEWR